jgi:cytochrome c6
VKLNSTTAAVILLVASSPALAFAQGSGADIYKTKCLMCHGADGLGATPAGKALNVVSFKTPAAEKATDAELIGIVKNGKNKMPAYAGKLTDDQIKAAVAYVRTLQK